MFLGGVFWIAIIAGAAWVLGTRRGDGGSTSSVLARHLLSRPAHVDVKLPYPVIVEVGDEVHLADASGEVPDAARPVGEIEAILAEDGSELPHLYTEASAFRVRIHQPDRVDLRADAAADLVRVPQTGAWVAQTLLTRRTIPRIAQEWNLTMLEHREQIFALVTPIVRDCIIDIQRHVEREMPPFLARHREEVGRLSAALEGDVRGKDMPAVFEKEIWPMAQPHLRPVLDTVSREIWDQIPLWGFSWKIAYGALPFTDNDAFQNAWLEFVEGQVAPIIGSHSEELFAAGKAIFRDVLANERISERIRAAFTNLIEHPEFHALTHVFLKEVFLDNTDFHEAMRARAGSAEVRRALAVASTHLEPMIRRMGDIILGTREDGVTREFARVLRAQILHKDLQRVVIRRGSEGAPPLARGARIDAGIEWEVGKR
jgi:hypothetical protein